MESGEKRKLGTVLKRILAGLLAVITGLTAILYVETSVRDPAVKDRLRLLASAQLLQSDEYVNMSRGDRMTQYMKYFLTFAKGYEDYETGASIAIAQGHYEDAIPCLEKALEVLPAGKAPEPVYYRLAYLCILAEKKEDALGWLNKALAGLPGAEGYLLRAQLRADGGDSEEAMADIRRYEAVNGADPESAIYPAAISEKAGQYEIAEAYYDLALTAKEPESVCYLNRAHCRMERGNMPGAEEDCAAYLAAGGTERLTVSQLLGIGYMRVEDYDRAAACFADTVEKTDNADVSTLYYAAMTAFISENYATAAAYGEQAILKGGRPRDMKLDLDSNGLLEIRAAGAEVTDLYRITGVSETHIGEYAKAEQHLTGCLSEMEAAGVPEEGNLFYLRAVCEMALGKFGNAAKDLDKALENGADQYGCLYSKGVCLYMTGDPDGAAECLNQVVLFSGDDTLVRNAETLMNEILSNKGEQQK